MLLSCSEWGDRNGYCREWVRQLIKSGRLQANKVGRGKVWLIDSEAIIAPNDFAHKKKYGLTKEEFEKYNKPK